MAEERHHRQVADKAFEDKARNGLIKFVDDKGIKYRELYSHKGWEDSC